LSSLLLWEISPSKNQQSEILPAEAGCNQQLFS